MGRQRRSVHDMTTFHDVPADLLIPALAAHLSAAGAVSRPEWADHVKTGVHRERPPEHADWWEVRAAALLRKIGLQGPVGVNHLSQAYGGSRDRGSNPDRARAGSRHIIRSVLQQLEQAGLVKMQTNVPGTVTLGRNLTNEGHKLLDEIAAAVRPQADELYAGLEKY